MHKLLEERHDLDGAISLLLFLDNGELFEPVEDPTTTGDALAAALGAVLLPAPLRRLQRAHGLDDVRRALAAEAFPEQRR